MADVVPFAVFIETAFVDGDAVAGETSVAFFKFGSFFAGKIADETGIVAGNASAVFAPFGAGGAVHVTAAGFTGAFFAGVAVAAGGIAEFTPGEAEIAGTADAIPSTLFIGTAFVDGDTVAGEAPVAFFNFVTFPAINVAEQPGIVAFDAFACFTPQDPRLTIRVGFAGVVFRQTDASQAIGDANPFPIHAIAGGGYAACFSVAIIPIVTSCHHTTGRIISFAGFFFRHADSAAAFQRTIPLADTGVTEAVQGNAFILGNQAFVTRLTIGFITALGTGRQTLHNGRGLPFVRGAPPE
jgi:hypothetical protein